MNITEPRSVSPGAKPGVTGTASATSCGAGGGVAERVKPRAADRGQILRRLRLLDPVRVVEILDERVDLRGVLRRSGRKQDRQRARCESHHVVIPRRLWIGRFLNDTVPRILRARVNSV